MSFGFTVCWWIGKRFQIWINTCLKQAFPGGPSSETQRIMVKMCFVSAAIKIFHEAVALVVSNSLSLFSGLRRPHAVHGWF